MVKPSSLTFGLGIAGAIGAGLLATFLLTQASQTESIVVAAQNLSPYTSITATDLQTIQVPKSLALANVVTNPSEILGRYLLYRVPQGYPMEVTAFQTASSFSDFLTQYVEMTGQQGVEIALPATGAVAQMIQPGQTVGFASGNFSTTIKILSVLPATKSASAQLMIFAPLSQETALLKAAQGSGNSYTLFIVPQNTTSSAVVSTPNPSSTPSSVNNSVQNPIQVGGNVSTSTSTINNSTTTETNHTAGIGSTQSTNVAKPGTSLPTYTSPTTSKPALFKHKVVSKHGAKQ